MKLPFLKNKSWPRKLKLAGESHYGFSEDDELKSSALTELCDGVAAKDSKKVAAALKALIQLVLSQGESDASTYDQA